MDENSALLVSMKALLQNLSARMDKQGEQLDKQGDQLENLSARMDKQGEQLENLSARMDKQGEQLENLSARMDKQGEQLDKQGDQLENLSARMDKQGERMDSIESYIGQQGPPSPSKITLSGGSSNNKKSSPITPKTSKLRTAYANASSHSNIEIAAPVSSRNIPELQLNKLMVHRMRTEPQLKECHYVALSLCESTVLPTPSKGFSLFVILSEDPTVVTEAHAARGAITKRHSGCVSWHLSTLPSDLVITLDHVLESSIDGKPIVWHATLSPVVAMTFSSFVAAFEGWSGAMVCALQGAGDVCDDEVYDDEVCDDEVCDVDEDVDDDDDEEAIRKDHLCIFSKSTASYAVAKLSAHAVVAQAQNAGGSPGTV